MSAPARGTALAWLLSAAAVIGVFVRVMVERYRNSRTYRGGNDGLSVTATHGSDEQPT